MPRDYTHELGTEVRSISGGYELEREETMEIAGRQVLYAVGNAVADSSCCGYWGCRYAVVPGYVVRWKYRLDVNGRSVSSVEPLSDPEVRQDITRFLERNEAVTQVQFL